MSPWNAPTQVTVNGGEDHENDSLASNMRAAWASLAANGDP